MLKTIKNTIACSCLLAFSTLANATDSDALPPIYEFYPDCDYPVIETIKVKRKMLMKNNELDRNSEKFASSESLKKIRKIAAEKGAAGIILTRRNILNERTRSISKVQNKQPMLEITAQLLGACENSDWVFSDKPAPVDTDGKTKMHLNLGTIGGWKKDIVLEVGDKYSKLEPELANKQIGFEQAYGLPLGASVEQAMSTYGTPSIHMSLGDNGQLLGFGRNHWLLFVNNQLHSVSSKNHWLSSEVVNYIPFDERFGDSWSVLGKISESDDISVALKQAGAKRQNSTKQVIIPGTNSQLVLWYDGVVKDNDKIVQKITGYSLQRKVHANTDKPNDSQQVYAVIHNYLQQEEQLGFERQQVQPMAIGEIWQDKMSKMLLFNGHLMALVKGESVSKLFFLEQVFSDDYQPEKSGWAFNRVKQGQTMDDVMTLLGDEAFGFDDTLEVSTEPYSKQLYFYDDKLIAAEVAIF